MADQKQKNIIESLQTLVEEQKKLTRRGWLRFSKTWAAWKTDGRACKKDCTDEDFTAGKIQRREGKAATNIQRALPGYKSRAKTYKRRYRKGSQRQKNRQHLSEKSVTAKSEAKNGMAADNNDRKKPGDEWIQIGVQEISAGKRFCRTAIAYCKSSKLFVWIRQDISWQYILIKIIYCDVNNNGRTDRTYQRQRAENCKLWM